MNLLTISIGRNILRPESRERARMRLYASELKEMHIVVLTRREHGFREVVHEGNLHLYPTNSRSRAGMLFDAYRIGMTILRERGAMTISAQDPFFIGLFSLVLARRTGARFHVQVHGDHFGDSHWKEGSSLRPLWRMLARFVIARAARVRVVSERIKRSLTALHVDEARIVVLPIRPELETFLNTAHEVGDHDPFVFLAVSRFAPEKNIPLMIRAFARVHTEHPPTRLRLVGGGSEEGRIRALVHTLGLQDVVMLVPWTEAVEREMERADVFLSTSDHEAYGLTLIEAMAVGLPVVTTDVGCVGEVLVDGLHGIVVPVCDEDAYVKAMERMVTDLPFRRTCSAAGKSTAALLASVTPEAYAKQWVAAL